MKQTESLFAKKNLSEHFYLNLRFPVICAPSALLSTVKREVLEFFLALLCFGFDLIFENKSFLPSSAYSKKEDKKKSFFSFRATIKVKVICWHKMTNPDFDTNPRKEFIGAHLFRLWNHKIRF